MENLNTEREYPYHERLTLRNFTVFADQTFEFVSGINVLIGANGTGKTHVLKALYGWHMASHLYPTNDIPSHLYIPLETYGIRGLDNLKLNMRKPTIIAGKFGEHSWQQEITSSTEIPDFVVNKRILRPIFIPANDMMGHTKNMLGIMRDYADFDRTCMDFLSVVTAEPVRVELNGAMPALKQLQKIMPGAVEWNSDEQRFYLIEKKRRIPFPIVAEGVRKISGLYRLIQNGWLKPGTTLFWDEPEANINPGWMDEIVETLVLLAESGVQIFLATHDYVVLKELDLLLRERAVQKKPVVTARYFALDRDKGVTTATWSDDFSELKPNAILDQYRQMMGRDMRLQDFAE